MAHLIRTAEFLLGRTEQRSFKPSGARCVTVDSTTACRHAHDSWHLSRRRYLYTEDVAIVRLAPTSHQPQALTRRPVPASRPLSLEANNSRQAPRHTHAFDGSHSLEVNLGAMEEQAPGRRRGCPCP